MKKKIICFVLVATILLPIISISVFANNSADTKIVVDSKSGLAGSTVTINVRVENNPGIAGMILTLDYDDGLTLVDAQNGEATTSLTFTKPGVLDNHCRFSWDSENSESTENGNILILTFKVSEYAAVDNSKNVKVSYLKGDIFNSDFHNIDAEITNGLITIVDYKPGDVTRDSLVNGKDVTALRRYIAGGYDVSINEYAADVNNDDIINGKDIVLLRRAIVGGYDVELLHHTVRHSHNMQVIEAKRATCTDNGNIQYWYCSDCEKYYSDYEGINEVSLSDTIIITSGHTYSKSWSYNETNHWKTSTCGHVSVSEYEKHSFDELNKCEICGYVLDRTSYQDDYLKYSEIGKTIDLINASDYQPITGGKNVFSNELYYNQLNIFSLGIQNGSSISGSSIEDVSSELAANVNAKISFGSRTNKNGAFLTNKLPSIDLDVSGGFETKKTSETKMYNYIYSYIYGGKRVEMSEFRNLDKLQTMVSPELLIDAVKVREGKLSAKEFVDIWGTHVITSAIYGSEVSVSYIEVDNSDTDYNSWKAALDLAFSQRFLKTGVNVNLSADAHGIETSSSKTSTKNLSTTVKALKILASSNLDEFSEQFAEWQKAYVPDTDSVLVDIGDAGLCCVWYLLDDSYNDVKEILDDYMLSQCSGLYSEYINKVRSLSIEDDVTFDIDSGTLKINISSYQEKGSIEGFIGNDFVSYKNGTISIMPYYNGNQIKAISFNGNYKHINKYGKTIDTIIDNVSIKFLSGNWYNDLKLYFNDVGIIGSDNDVISFEDYKNSPALNIYINGNNLIKAKTSANEYSAIVARDLTIFANDKNDVLYIYGGDGSDATENSGDGFNGGSAIEAENLLIDGRDGTIIAFGGSGGNGKPGEDKGSQGKAANGSGSSNGANGKAGSEGNKGGNGGNAQCAIRTKSFRIFSGNVKMTGGNAGSGAVGGRGQDGQAGGNGQIHEEKVWVIKDHCKGMDAGNGGAAGKGGRGGDSGYYAQGYSSDTPLICENGSYESITGKKGSAGEGGAPGNPGNGGERGYHQHATVIGTWADAEYGASGTRGASNTQGDNGIVHE